MNRKLDKIVICGASGLLGGYLQELLSNSGYDVVAVARSQPYANWERLEELLDGATALINLCGKSIFCAHTAANRTLMRASRLQPTRQLADIIARLPHPPHLWINASGISIYAADGQPHDENYPKHGRDFLATLTRDWEQEFFRATLPHTRRVALRLAPVLTAQGGMLQPLKTLCKFGLGGRLGSGKQAMNWLHVADLAGIIDHLIANPQLHGAVNALSPHNPDNATFMACLRRIMQVSFGLPQYAWMLRPILLLRRLPAGLLFDSQTATADKLLKSGYVFMYPQLKPALKNLLQPAAKSAKCEL